MRVLIACEFSGVVREAFAKLGHDAWSCDLLPTAFFGTSHKHFQCDVKEVLNMGWDLMIAHPPCTYLSNAGARFLYPKGKLNAKRYSEGLAGKDFFEVLLNANIEKIAVENPTPSSVFQLPQPSQIIQPYMFGEPFKKRTLLWLKNLSPLIPTNIVEGSTTKANGNWFNKGGKERQKNRSVTFPGIANAMAEQWGILN